MDELGHAIRPELFGDIFAKIAKAAGLPKIRLHDLRHTAAILGHADAAFTLRTYVHSSDEAMSAASATLANLFESRSAVAL